MKKKVYYLLIDLHEDLHEIYSSQSQSNKLCHNTFRVAPFSVVFEKKILKCKFSQKMHFRDPCLTSKEGSEVKSDLMFRLPTHGFPLTPNL